MSAAHDDLEGLKAFLLDNLERLAVDLFGPPNPRLSSKRELRFGPTGKISVDLSRRRGSWKEHGTSEGGGTLQAIKFAHKSSWSEAIRWGFDWRGGHAAAPARRPSKPTENAGRARKSDYHLQLAAQAISVQGTLAERYLREHRGIEGLLPPEARFHPRVWHSWTKKHWPALILIASDASGPRRVQAVFLDPTTGAKAAVETVKLTFGANASHVPAVLAARHKGGPIYIMEGPEDAATIWSLSGGESLATFGSGNLSKVELPPSSDVVICGDATGEGRAAAQGAAKRYAAQGHRVRLVFPTIGKDFNEALRLAGPDRTRAMLLQATPYREHGLPAYYAAPTMPREQALQLQGGTIKTAISGGLRRARALREIDRRLGELDPAMSPEARVAARSAVTREVTAEFGAVMDHRAILLTGSQGTGKTLTTLLELAEQTALLPSNSGLVVHAYEQDLEKVRELTIDYAKHAKSGSQPVKAVIGRSAPDPARNDGSPMCPRHKAVNRAAAAGVDVRKLICGECPLARNCGTLRQEREIDAMQGGVFVHCHAYLFLHSPAPAADLVIVDESAIFSALSDVRELHPDAMVDPVPYSGDNLKEVMDANRIINQVARALQRPNSLAAIRSAGLTEDEIRAARKTLEAAIEAQKPSVSGSMTDDEIIEKLDLADGARLGRISALLGAVIRELNQPRSTFNAITFDQNRLVRVNGQLERQPRLRVHSLRKPVNASQEAGLLLMDGTGSLWLNEKVFGPLKHVHVPIERDAFVIGTSGKSYSTQSVSGLDRHGNALRADAGKKLRGEIKLFVDCVAKMSENQRVVVVAQKRAADVLRAEGLKDVAHFGKLRGHNCYEDCGGDVVVGREAVSVEGLEDLTRAFLADDPVPFISHVIGTPADWPYQHWPFKATRGRRMRDGTVQPVEVEVHPDPRAQEVLEQLREANIVQGADRCRPIFQRRRIGLLNDLVVDVTYDRVVRHDQLASGGNRLHVAWEASGFLPLSPADLHRAHSNIVPSESSARDALRAVGKNGGVRQIVSYLGGPPFSRFVAKDSAARPRGC